MVIGGESRMKYGRQWLMVGAIALLAGCSVSINGGDNAASDQSNEAAAAPAAAEAEPAAETAPAAASNDAAGDWQRVILVGLTSGDNFYLTIAPGEGGDQQQVMCTAAACEPWFEAGELPSSVQGSIVEVQMGAAPQVDGSGNVMEANFPAITALRQTSR
jgi:hypothetical protein